MKGLYVVWIMFLLTSCIGDDILFDTIEPTLKITNKLDSLKLGDTYQFEIMYLNNVGKPENITPNWKSSDENILTINSNGLATAIQEGKAIISVNFTNSEGKFLESFDTVMVGKNTVVISSERKGTLKTTSGYTLQGDFVMKEENGIVTISFSNNYRASSNLPGLYLYLTNNPNSVSGALEIGRVTVFNGVHSYTLSPNVQLNSYNHLLYYCKPFNVKVGEGNLSK